MSRTEHLLPVKLDVEVYAQSNRDAEMRAVVTVHAVDDRPVYPAPYGRATFETWHAGGPKVTVALPRQGMTDQIGASLTFDSPELLADFAKALAKLARDAAKLTPPAPEPDPDQGWESDDDDEDDE